MWSNVFPGLDCQPVSVWKILVRIQDGSFDTFLSFLCDNLANLNIQQIIYIHEI